ncbi:hypothetical protein [Desulfobotulus mexicanus]|uniref:Uncharacterized protein n=1 Tax=Desulfobotulus mexicanus TaxID=2586642 RepID=A0A5S5MDX7_9BACT|nr:hypothetical protein [Desulfobotulus mexicanus]TYT73936.1 hypothetical protein FIM25_12285 [Desulfobotulus mexicanus]
MKQAPYKAGRHDDTLECYTRFRMDDRICREFCAVRLRCLIAQQQQLEAIFHNDDIFFMSEENPMNMQ